MQGVQEKKKKKWGDRRDGTWLRELDPMHAFLPYLYPNRTDNEAFISERIDITAIQQYLEKKNEQESDFPYTLFHVLIAAIVKTVSLRPELNRFIKGKRVYLRNHLSVAFVVKKKFRDDANEALAFLQFDDQATIDTIHEKIREEIYACRSDVDDNSTKGMDMMNKLPRPVLSVVMGVLNILDFYGHVPYSLVKTDPNHATVFLSNLGSIKLRSGYHHLTNWGTNSLFVVLGEKKKAPVDTEGNGNYVLHDVIDIGLTIDERIADGYYYSKSIRLLKHLLQHPELLERPAGEPVEY